MRLLSSASRFTISASVIAIGAAWASPALAQAPAPQSCANIADAAAKQACADAAAKQVDPNANEGELDTSPTKGGAANAQSTSAKENAIVVTGSRLHRDERTSPDPVQVIDPNVENREGKLNTAEILQTSPLAQGSTQITSTLSTNFVVNGGEGAEAIDLRGLGANRTLVLLNGRRAGPAGTRGGVSAFDLNVIPEDAIQSVEILKTGASSVYGSDAIAGVVNLITKKDLRGLQVRGFANVPTDPGGEEYSLSGIYGVGLGDRGHIMVSANYYKRNALTNGDRPFFGCTPENIKNPSGGRADAINPNTGKPFCGGFLNDVLLVANLEPFYAGSTNLFGPPVGCLPGARSNITGNICQEGDLTRRPITAVQYNRPGDNLDQFLPGLPGVRPGFEGQDFSAPGNVFGVGTGLGPNGLALEHDYNHALDQDSIIPKTKRWTLYGEGGYDVTDNVNLYFEGLYNRRKTDTIAHRQLFFYQFTGNSDLDCGGGPGSCNDPFNTEFSGEQLIEPVVIAPFNSSTDVKYLRLVGGAHADLQNILPHGFADFYYQHSRSDGDYSRDIIFDDAVDFGVAAYRTGSCAGTVTAIRGIPCLDIDYTDPRVLAGNFTPQEQAFLFGVDKGNTLYKQDTAEFSFGGDAFKLPYGPLRFALGAQWRRDSIDDVPGEVNDPNLKGNIWGSTTAGETAGHETTKEIFGEIEIPILANLPGVQNLTFNGAARLTNTEAVAKTGETDKDSGNWTYKLAGNYSPVSWLRLRSTYGTSFRSPALFEQFLADESGFLGQSSIDPCIHYGDGTRDVSQEIQTNCASQGIPVDYAGRGGSAQIFSGGGIGLLDPETSKALTMSVIFTPDGWVWSGGQFSFAVDYVDIKVKNEVTQLGAANILNGCYTSDSFPNDPLCALFVRAPSTAANAFSVLTVKDPYLNINSQQNKSIDFTTRFRQDLGGWGSLSLLGQATWTLKDKQELFQGVPFTNNGRAGDPHWVGDLNVAWNMGSIAPVTLTYAFNYIGKTNNFHDMEDIAGTGNVCVSSVNGYAARGGQYCPVYKLPAVTYSSLSAEVQVTHDMSFLIGVSNLFDKQPPRVSTIGTPIQAIGAVAVNGTYYDYFGRRLFVSVHTNLPKF